MESLESKSNSLLLNIYRQKLQLLLYENSQLCTFHMNCLFSVVFRTSSNSPVTSRNFLPFLSLIEYITTTLEADVKSWHVIFQLCGLYLFVLHTIFVFWCDCPCELVNDFMNSSLNVSIFDYRRPYNQICPGQSTLRLYFEPNNNNYLVKGFLFFSVFSLLNWMVEVIRDFYV